MKLLITLLAAGSICVAQTLEKPVFLAAKTTFFDAKVIKNGPFSVKVTHKNGLSTLHSWELTNIDQKALGFDPEASSRELSRITLQKQIEDARKITDRAVQSENARIAAAEKQKKQDAERQAAVQEARKKEKTPKEREAEDQEVLRLLYESGGSEVVYSRRLRKYFSHRQFMALEELLSLPAR